MLPELKYAWRKTQRDVLAIRGINYSDELADGDLADSAGLSTRRYPYFATRNARPTVEGYADVTAVYRYKDDVFTVYNGKLRYGITELCDVTPGAKQFVTVNTKVIVFPDKLMVDMTLNPPTVRRMAATLTTAGNNITMTDHTITIPSAAIVDGECLPHRVTMWVHNGYWFRTYNNANLAWDAENNTYTFTAENTVIKEIFSTTVGVNTLSVGDVLIPVAAAGGWDFQYHRTSSYTIAPSDEEVTDDLTQGNGYYLVVSKIEGQQVYYDSTGRYGYVRVSCTVHNLNVSNPDLKTLFREGDAVTISGHPCPRNNMEVVFTKGVSEETLTFDAGTFMEMSACGTFTSSNITAINAFSGTEGYANFKSRYFYLNKQDGKWCFKHDSTYYPAEAGQMLIVGEDSKYYLMRLDETVVEVDTTGVLSDVQKTDVAETSLSPLKLTITRKMPEMDYICEKDNRLWGVVNKQDNRVWDKDENKWKTFDSRLIVASSLGEPDDFYDYTGAYGGAYAVAVASEGDFTGITAYGDSVLAWKEKKLCKVMGDYPANYSLNEYTVDGLQAGAHGTQVNISETLIYKGVNGVYAYAGGTPRLISPQFGQRRYVADAAGTDGERYYITLTDAAGQTHLHSYDVQRGLWLRESGENAVGYVDLPAGFCALMDDGKLYRMDNGEDDAALEWHAQFTPLYETMAKKRYAKLILRLELGSGAFVRIMERVDGSLWRQIGRITAAAKNPVTVPVPIARGDKMEFRLEGKGACTILGIERQFFLHSEV